MNDCPTGQQPYPTAHAAWRIIQFLASKRALKTHKHTGKQGGVAYHCRQCGHWHMTTRRREPLEPLKARPQQWTEEARG